MQEGSQHIIEGRTRSISVPRHVLEGRRQPIDVRRHVQEVPQNNKKKRPFRTLSLFILQTLIWYSPDSALKNRPLYYSIEFR